ncbi:Retrotransposon-derived protein peg10 [Ascosphaera pollenicola]|nr:Retrotransposon-derived protein peg10 [Ascosphaera pollenicola]
MSDLVESLERIPFIWQLVIATFLIVGAILILMLGYTVAVSYRKKQTDHQLKNLPPNFDSLTVKDKLLETKATGSGGAQAANKNNVHRRV